MTRFRVLRRHTVFALALVGLLATHAQAQQFNPQQHVGRMQAAIQQAGGTCFTRQLPNGKQRLCFNTGNQRALDAACQVAGRGANVIQICHLNLPGLMHTMGMFDGGSPHFQTPDNFRTWRLNSWGGPYHSNRQIYSAFIQLTPSESSRLKQLFTEATQQQQANPNRTITAAWARGNCASLWTNLPVGDHGETLGQLVGVGTQSHPHYLQKALETQANERVFAVGVYGPAINGFGQNPNQPLFTFIQ